MSSVLLPTVRCASLASYWTLVTNGSAMNKRLFLFFYFSHREIRETRTASTLPHQRAFTRKTRLSFQRRSRGVRLFRLHCVIASSWSGKVRFSEKLGHRESNRPCRFAWRPRPTDARSPANGPQQVEMYLGRHVGRE